ncbi:MAG: fasciclin domain-containing protein [Croceibacterium sp.]
MAAGNSMVGGMEMYADKPIAVNASTAPNLTTLVSAVTAAGLGETLSGPGPFTVFAPTNDAFGKVDKATVDMLMKPENKAKLTKVLTYHVVAGKMTAADLMAAIMKGNGKAMLKTVEGESLTATMDGDKVKIAGMGGSTAYVSQADVMQSNGVVHVVDGVLTPKM